MMTWYQGIILLAGILIFMFVIGPIAMNMWGSMFGKGFFSNLKNKSKHKPNTDEYKENK